VRTKIPVDESTSFEILPRPEDQIVLIPTFSYAPDQGQNFREASDWLSLGKAIQWMAFLF
jgi:hypothetical protein